ncbi:hypothetical protein FGRMN_4679 [Fusarium graminum]|nr:hypothetical protein FGRMN_4679 [Fusarium graminum]
MSAREFHDDSAETEWAGSAADYDDFQMTHHDMDVLRQCIEAAVSNRNMPNGSIFEDIIDASPVPNLSSTSSSTEAHPRENSVVSSDGEDILAG